MRIQDSFRTLAILLLLAPMHAAAAASQEYPTRPIRIVTATPGGGNDYLARIISSALGAAVGQQVIVDNRPSRFVGGIVARSAPDGYTLAVGGGTMQFLQLNEKADYDILADFAPISQLERSPNVLVVNPSLKVGTVSELVALAKAKPGALLYGTGGTGTALHLAGEMFMIATKVKISRVPYKSTGPALLGLLTNEVHMVFSTPGGAMPHVKDGRLKALGVTSAQPSPLIPGVPTLASQGLKDYDLDTIGFILAPAKTPPPLVKRLNHHVVQIMSQGDVKERMAAGGSEVVTGTPEQLAAKLKSDDARMRKLYKDIGLTPEK
ncbi:MAG TPA: tripartite tricarboxylate transporter substrate binding protein [Burkholderiales bacterium]|nr:tripartite tricarboxylate transporter substrate binding protein [Burkholderiales bacterium]